MRKSGKVSSCLAFADVDAFPERAKDGSDITAICRCTPAAGCNDGCDNKIMHYTCGKDCPAGEACNNKSLWKRKQPALKVAYVSFAFDLTDDRLVLVDLGCSLKRISKRVTL